MPIVRSKIAYAQVQRAQKRVPYTVSPIGGKEELVQWRLDQAKREVEYQASKQLDRALLRANAVSAVASQAGRQLTDDEKFEISSRISRSAKGLDAWKPIPQERLFFGMDRTQYPVRFQPQPSLIDKVKKATVQWFSDLWTSAFRNEK